MLINDIKSSYVLARRYVERCCIQVTQDGKKIQAFTECEGKMRVTDWGGTSSAIYLLHQIGDSGTIDIREKIEEASKWLLADQSSEGSWEAAEMQCCEATAAVIFDLHKTDLLNKEKFELAINFIQSCYVQEGGYFISRPGVQQKPHLYTTYLAVKALAITRHNSFSKMQKSQIINWIDSAKAADDKWNATSQSINGDVSHTIFALLILYYSGVSVKEIKRKYRKQIKWLRSRIKDCSSLSGAFSYEATEAYDDSRSDYYGEGAFILKSYHFNMALLCHFFLKIKRMGIAQRLIQKMIYLRGQQEGWGLTTNGKIFVWATQQAIDCMCEFEENVFDNSIFGRLKSLIYSVPYFWAKFIVIVILIPTINWLLKDAQKGADIILSVVTMILPWLVKRED
jgi:prenyltransferase beta subunit